MPRTLNDLSSKMNTKVALYKPDALARDELGGVCPRSYSQQGSIWAQRRDKTSTFRQVIGDYVTVNTCYFVAWDFRSTYPIAQDWQLEVNGQRYIINSITIIDDVLPHRIEIEATALGGVA
ncbi:MAG: head-tail adaptor protein [Acidaminococcaceae bacterium]|nr:head-tail adaptor protein [Acidaminococcaceae bacterium]